MSMPTSRDEPAVTIENLARNVPRVSKFEGKSKLRGKVNVEGNISPRAILTKDGVKKVDVKTASALLELGSIIDLGKGVFLDADIAASAFGGKVGDQFRYRDIGGEVGIGIGKKISDSGQLGLKGTYRPGRGGQEDDYAVGLSYDRKFNKGGVVDMRQMEMFNIGGLKDEGGSRDSVSGNDVPSGSLKEEVRDDIDAKLSPGEFVFPADVVRYIGLEKLMLMRDKAKKGLKRMEEMGQMGNSEEATLDDDVPFEQSDLLIVAGSPMEEQMNTLNRGGMPIRASNGAFATYGPSGAPTYSTTAPGSSLGGGRGDQLLGSNLQQYFNPTTNEIRSVLVSRDNLTGELKPVSPLPEGFIRDTPENRTNAMEPTDPSARVETSRVDPDTAMRGSSMPGGPSRSDLGMSEMSTRQQATMADIPASARPAVAGFFGLMSRGFVSKDQVMRDFAIADKAAATLKAMTPAQLAVQMAKDQQQEANTALGQMEEAYGAPVGMFGTAISVNDEAYAVDLDTNTVYSLDDYSSRIGKEKEDILNAARAQKLKKGFDTSMTGGSGDPIGDPDPKGSVAEMQSQDPAETGSGASGATGPELGGPPDDDPETAAAEEGEFGGVEGSKGGFIPKRKKQKKKMKRGGLASRK